MLVKLTRKKKDLVFDPNWPQAVPNYLVCRTEHDLKARALSISEWAGYKDPFLDFGCGDGKVVEILKNQGFDAIGYEKNQSWISGTFNTVLLHDVMDHLDNPIVELAKIRNVLSNCGEVKIRCHPWCSRHGGHQILQYNKAFAHLIYPDKWKTNKIENPILNYENMFSFVGFKIKQKNVYTRKVEDWILNNFGNKILSYWNEEWNPNKTPCCLPFLEIEYIDYTLGV